MNHIYAGQDNSDLTFSKCEYKACDIPKFVKKHCMKKNTSDQHHTKCKEINTELLHMHGVQLDKVVPSSFLSYRVCPPAAGPQCTSKGEERSGMEPPR